MYYAFCEKPAASGTLVDSTLIIVFLEEGSLQNWLTPAENQEATLLDQEPVCLVLEFVWLLGQFLCYTVWRKFLNIIVFHLHQPTKCKNKDKLL